MAILDSIAIEIQLLVAGMLVLLIITILEIIDLQRGKKQHQQDLHAISRGAIPPQKVRVVSLFSLILEFIFGFAAFTLFIAGLMHLLHTGMPVLAAVAGVCAVVAVLMPFLIWGACRKANKETRGAIESLGRRRHTPASQEQIRKPNMKAPDVQAAVVAPPLVDEPLSSSDEPAAREPLPAAKPQLAPKFTVKAKPYEPTRPTDSMLRRHYDAMLASQTLAMSAEPVAVKTPAPASPTSCRKEAHEVKLPEDSMLKRHFLTTLRMKIEARLSLPARPTDSMLRRHFDAMKADLIAMELNNYLEG